MFKIYFTPRNCAQGFDGGTALPHYGDESYPSRAAADNAVAEAEEDRLDQYWNMAVHDMRSEIDKARQ